MGEAEREPLRVEFDRRVNLEFHGSRVTSDAGLLPDRELDDVLGLIGAAGAVLIDRRTRKNGRHGMAGLFRQCTDADGANSSVASKMHEALEGVQLWCIQT